MSDLPITAYYRFFPEPSSAGQRVGEFSPVYMAQEETLIRIREELPEVKVLVALRNPVDRCFSHFRYDQHFNQLIDHGVEFRDALVRYPYLLDLGRYAAQLRNLFATFPATQVKVILFEELISSPKELVTEVYRFLELGDDFEPTIRQVNSSKVVRYQWLRVWSQMPGRIISTLQSSHPWVNRWVCSFMSSALYPRLLAIKHWVLDKNATRLPPTRMSSSEYEYLRQYYRDDIMACEQVLERDLQVWKT